jgi:biotin carboxyl carrier protein
MTYTVTIGDETFEVEIEDKDGEPRLNIDGFPLELSLSQVSGPGHLSLILDGRSYEAMIESRSSVTAVTIEGELYEVQVVDSRSQKLRQFTHQTGDEGLVTISAPMPGLVVEVEVAPGDSVEKGQGVCIVEAMKMQNEMKAPRAGVVKEVSAKYGSKVERGDPLVVLE